MAQLSEQLLSVNRVEVDGDKIPQFFDRFEDLIWLCQHNENDAYLSMRLVFQMMVLPLTKQLTNLAGNLWSRTLTGGRAERNEYLLLHEFYKRGYIVPDKTFVTDLTAVSVKGKTSNKKKVSNKNVSINEIRDNNEENEEIEAQQTKKISNKRKPAYAGGLVLEPKKGLYDKYVLMLDFNSLYPSIIQEYNICFTTVERHLVSVIINLNPNIVSNSYNRLRMVMKRCQSCQIAHSSREYCHDCCALWYSDADKSNL